MEKRPEITVNDIYREIYVKPGDLARRLADKYGYLPYMIQRYIEMLGISDTIKLLDSFEKPVKPAIRVNTHLIEPDKLVSRLNKMGFVLEEIGWSNGLAYRVIEEPTSPSIGATHEYLKGYYYVHRDAAPLVPSILLIHDYRGDVLDACAAPGGKATHIAQVIRNSGIVYANDIALYRLKALIGHFMRMKLDNVRVLWSDARKLPRLLKRRFKRVLLDVPCSGEGTIMLDPGRKTRTRILDLARIVKREIELLWSGLELLEPGGILAYVTCSIAPEENEYVLSKIMSYRNDVVIVEPPLKLFNWSPWFTELPRFRFPSELRKCIRIWPHIHGMIGMTICLLSISRN
ncbi:MAG: RsmB/NOP family class I SAM-dependent RNA methyltransferase [Thermoprotei archaeon]